MKRLAGRILELAFGAAIVAACAGCVFFSNKKVLATLTFACALLSGAGLATAAGNFLIVYSIFGIVFLTAEILTPLFFGMIAFFLATIFFRAYGRAKYAEGYDNAKKT